jgi:hypothetical protein
MKITAIDIPGYCDTQDAEQATRLKCVSKGLTSVRESSYPDDPNYKSEMLFLAVPDQKGKKLVCFPAHACHMCVSLFLPLQISGLDICKNLIRIDLSGNALTSADNVSVCSNLRWLNLSRNAIDSIQDIVHSCELLEVLNVSQNKLSGKVGVGRLRKLKALVLNGNEVVSVGGLEKTTQLETLIISNNNVQALGGWISQAKSIQKLSASNNPMSWGDGEVSGLSQLVNMKELRLNHTGMGRVPEYLMCMKRLRILELGSNSIESFDDMEVLSSLRSVWQLNLKGNPVVRKQGYQERIQCMMPQVDVLDTKRLRPKGSRYSRSSEDAVKDVKDEGLGLDSSTRKIGHEVEKKDEENDKETNNDKNNKEEDDDDVIDPQDFVVKAKESSQKVQGASKRAKTNDNATAGAQKKPSRKEKSTVEEQHKTKSNKKNIVKAPLTKEKTKKTKSKLKAILQGGSKDMPLSGWD